MKSSKKAPPSVTWLLPVKNGMPYLPETLASIAAQTCGDYQVLAWDNGSTDTTIEELRSWIPSRACQGALSSTVRQVLAHLSR